MKKKILTLTILTAVLSLASCSTNPSDTNGTGTESISSAGSSTTEPSTEYTSLKDCFSLKDGTKIESLVTVTGTDSVGLYLQDDTASFYAYYEDNVVNYSIGKKYVISGSITSYASNKQIAKGFKLTPVGEGNINTLTINNVEDIKTNQYAPIKASVRLTGDPLSFKDGFDNSFNIEIAGTSVPVFIKKKLSKSSMFTKFNNIKKYEFFTIDGVFANAYETNVQISLTDPAQIVIETPTNDDEKIAKAEKTISYITDLDGYKINYSIYLPTKLSDGVSLSWTSSNPSVLSNEGKVSRPTTNSEVSLSCEISSGSKTVTTSTRFTILSSESDDLINEALAYYNSISFTSTNSQTLKNDLYQLIKNKTVISYNNLVNVFSDSDTYIDSNGNTYLIDIYSNNNYKLNQTASKASKEGQGYNKEHSVPQSWFSEASPMKSDAFHIFPTDTYVNSKRSNYPFGEVSNSTYTSSNGSKAGSNIFEVADEYKGDIARVYLYMATAYQDKCGSWSGGVFQSSFPHIKTNTLKMFLQWTKDDPVSEREILRNNAIYKHQGNRNPFVDKPSLAKIMFPSYF